MIFTQPQTQAQAEEEGEEDEEEFDRYWEDSYGGTDKFGYYQRRR